MDIFDRPLSSTNEYWRSPVSFQGRHNRKGGTFDTIDLLAVVTKLWVRRRLIIVSMVICGALGYGVAKLITPSYVSTALVMIEPQQAVVGNSNQIVRAGIQSSSEAMTTETFVLRSRGLASDTIERLHLDRDPELNPPLREANHPLPLFAPVLSLFDKLGNWYLDATGSTPLTASDENNSKFEIDKSAIASKSDTEVVNAVLRRLRVTLQEQSNVIEVSFSSSNPKTAALVPNTLIEAYLDRRGGEKDRGLAGERKWLESVLLKLSDKVHESELALADYRQKSGLVSEKNPILLEQEIRDTRARLAAARARTVEVTARLTQMQALALSPAQPASMTSTSSPATASETPGLQRLREHEVQLHGQLAAVSGSLGPNHPKTIQLEAQLRDLDNEIRREGAGGLKAELAAAQAAEAALDRKVVELTRNFAQVNGGDSRLQTLMAEAGADRQAYERYLALANEVLSNIGNRNPGGSLLSSADVPIKPSFPNKKIIVMAGVTIGAGAGMVLAAMIDLLRGGLRSEEQVEDALGVKCLGLVPRFKPPNRRRLRATELPRVIRASSPLKPRDRFFRQSVRSVEFKLLNFDRSNSRVVLVTAALPEEGKTSIAVSLAVSLARDGFGVVLVDCDLHRPTVHRMFNGTRGPGLVDYLVHGFALDQIIHQDATSRVDYIPAGTQLPREACDITPDRLHSLIDQLGQQYSFIILDSGPVLAVPETLALSQIAHKTILVVRWGRTPVAIARHAAMQLLDAGAETAAVLSMVDLQRSAKHGDPLAGAYKQLESYHKR